MTAKPLLALAISALFFLSSCICNPPLFRRDQIPSLLQTDRSAVTRLETGSSYCSAFHIGNDIFVSAAHCIQDTSDLSKLTLIDTEHGFRYYPKLLAYDPRKDLIILKTYKFQGASLEIADLSFPPPPGSELLNLGHPGYYSLEFTFGYGFLKEYVRSEEGLHLVIADGISSPGYSGGPVLDARTNKVVGINHIMIDRSVWFNPLNHQEHWVSAFISYQELLALLKENYIEI